MKRISMVVALGALAGCSMFRPYPDHFYEHVEKEKAKAAAAEQQDLADAEANARQRELNSKFEASEEGYATEACDHAQELTRLHLRMQEQKDIEKASGVMNARIRREIGEATVREDKELKASLIKFQKRWGKPYDWNCPDPQEYKDHLKNGGRPLK